MVIPLSLSSVMYTQYIPIFILLFRFDDDTKLKKRDWGDVPYLKKSVSYLQKTLNQIGINKKKVAISALFPPFEGYFPIFFSLEMTLYSEGDMP